MNLRFVPKAFADLKRLHDFIAEENPVAARRSTQRLVGSIRLLQDQPKMGILIPLLQGERQWVGQEYVVRYRIVADTIEILQIWHGRENRPQ